MRKLVGLFVCVIFIATGCALGPYTRYVASRIEGRLLESGRPMAHVRVTREIVVQHNGQKTTQHAVTDDEGRFSLDEVTTIGYVESIATWVYHFEISAEANGGAVTLWKGWKPTTSALVTTAMPGIFL